MAKSLTRFEVGQRMFAILNYSVGGPAPDPVPPALHTAVLDCINGAIEEMINEAPVEVFSAARASLELGGWAEVNVFNVSHGSERISITTTVDIAPRLAGCAILLPGDTRINRLVCNTYNPTGTAVVYFKLAYPYLNSAGGSLGTPPTTGTVYFDTWQLREDEVALLEPVEIHLANGSRQELVQAFDSLWSERAMVNGSTGSLIGYPDSFAVETVQSESSWGVEPGDQAHQGQLCSWVRLNKWAESNYSLLYRAKLKPEMWELADIMSPDDNGALLAALPQGWESSVLIPIAEQRLTSMRTFLSETITAIDRYTREGILSEVFRKYEAALKILRNLHPRRQGASYMVVSN